MNGYIVSKIRKNGKINIESSNGIKNYISRDYYYSNIDYYNNIAEMAKDYLKRNLNIKISNIIEFEKILHFNRK